MRISKNNAIKCLKDLKEVFDKNKIPFWLEDGTLLGAVRDKIILPWDDDIDLGILEDSVAKDSVKRKLSRDLAEKGFYIYFFENVVNIKRGDIIMDIALIKISPDKKYAERWVYSGINFFGSFLVRLKKLSKLKYYGRLNFKLSNPKVFIKTNMFCLASYLPVKLKQTIYKIANTILFPFKENYIHYLKVPAKYFLKLKTLEFYSLKFYIPSFAEEYLRKKYGDWKNPPKDPSKWMPFIEGEWIKKSMD